MAKEVENQGIINMTDQQVFDELINLHAKAAGESLSSILKADIEISGPEITEITVKEVCLLYTSTDESFSLDEAVIRMIQLTE